MTDEPAIFDLFGRMRLPHACSADGDALEGSLSLAARGAALPPIARPSQLVPKSSSHRSRSSHLDSVLSAAAAREPVNHSWRLALEGIPGTGTAAVRMKPTPPGDTSTRLMGMSVLRLLVACGSCRRPSPTRFTSAAVATSRVSP